jgi:CRP-like cAMP-binding protein
MKTEPLDKSLRQHAFAADLPPEMVSFLAGCTKNQRFDEGEYLFREGDRSSRLYLIRHGRVSFESYEPGHGIATLETVEDGDVIGWTALFEPYTHDGRAVKPTLTFSIDGECLLRKMDADSAFGYQIARRLLELTHKRLQRARLQQLDVYRAPK